MSVCVAAVLVDDLTRPTGVYAQVGTSSRWAFPVCAGETFAASVAELVGDEVVLGEELTSQIGHWPVGDGTDMAARYVVAPLDWGVEPPDGWHWVPAADIGTAPWDRASRAPALAAQSAMILALTLPRWDGVARCGDHVSLRPLTSDDVGAMAALWADAEVCRNLGHDALTLPQAELYVRGRLADATAGRFFPLVVVVGDEVVGEARITLTPRWSSRGPTGRWNASVGFAVRTDRQGSGIGTAVMTTLVTVCFDVLGVDWVRATVFDRSVASARVMDKVGFDRIGLNPECFRDLDGAWLGDHQFVYAREVWAARHSPQR